MANFYQGRGSDYKGNTQKDLEIPPQNTVHFLGESNRAAVPFNQKLYIGRVEGSTMEKFRAEMPTHLVGLLMVRILAVSKFFLQNLNAIINFLVIFLFSG